MRRIRLVLVLWFLAFALLPHGLLETQAHSWPGACRTFQSVDGSTFLFFCVDVLDTEASAKKLFAYWVSVGPEIYSAGGDFRPASVGQVGDETRAFFTEETADGSEPQRALVFWRDGPVFYTGLEGSRYHDPFFELLPVAQAITGRHYVDAPTNQNDMIRTGGVWDLLPSIDDVPDGFVFVRERDEHEATPTP